MFTQQEIQFFYDLQFMEQHKIVDECLIPSLYPIGLAAHRGVEILISLTAKADVYTPDAIYCSVDRYKPLVELVQAHKVLINNKDLMFEIINMGMRDVKVDCYEMDSFLEKHGEKSGWWYVPAVGINRAYCDIMSLLALTAKTAIAEGKEEAIRALKSLFELPTREYTPGMPAFPYPEYFSWAPALDKKNGTFLQQTDAVEALNDATLLDGKNYRMVNTLTELLDWCKEFPERAWVYETYPNSFLHMVTCAVIFGTFKVLNLPNAMKRK
jgi:hypothetical protein